MNMYILFVDHLVLWIKRADFTRILNSCQHVFCQNFTTNITFYFQSIILYSPEAVISRFDERKHAVDCEGVVEYIRALVVTNAIDEYLPNKSTGKPSSLPTLVILF
jgi:hypothetical protein